MPTLAIDIAARLATFQDSLDKIGRQGEQVAGRLNKAFGALKTGIAAIGASISAGAFAAFVKSGIDAADNLNKLSQKVGVTVESLSALQYAGRLADLSSEELASSLAKLARSASEATTGTGDTAAAFQAVGVAVKDAQGNLRGTEEILLDIADRFSKMEDSAGKTALAMRLFGKSGAEMIPFLNQGRVGIEALRQEAERLGIVISSDTAKRAEEFNDNLTRLAASSEKTKIALAEALLPTLIRISDKMAEAARNGEGLLGKLAAITALSPFDDLQRAQKELTEITDRLLSNETRLGRLGDSSFAEAARKSISQKIDADRQRAQELIKLLGVLRGETNAFGEATKKTEIPKTKAPALPSTGTDPGQQFLESLRKRLIALEENEFAALRFEAAQKKVLAAAEPLIAQLQRETEFRKEYAEAVQRDAAAVEAEQQRRAGLINGVGEYVKALEQETSLLSLSNEERAISVQLLKLEEAGIERNTELFAEAARRIRSAVFANAGAQLTKDVATPLERLNTELNRLRDLYGQNSISAETFRRAVEKANQEFLKSDDEAESLKDTVKSLGLTFSSAFEEAISGGKGLRDILKGIESDLLKLGTRKLVTEPLFKAFEGVLSNGVKGLFGSGNSSSVNYENSFDNPLTGGGGASGGILSFFSNIFSNLFRADGGPVTAGRGYVVGERGPEWFVPSQSGMVMASGAGGGVINYSPTFVIRGEQNTPQSRSQLAAAAWRGLQDGRRNL